MVPYPPIQVCPTPLPPYPCLACPAALVFMNMCNRLPTVHVSAADTGIACMHTCMYLSQVQQQAANVYLSRQEGALTVIDSKGV